MTKVQKHLGPFFKNFIFEKKVPLYLQKEARDCGPACLKAIAKYYGRNTSISSLREYSKTNKEGSNLYNLVNAAKKIGLEAEAVELTLDDIVTLQRPIILHWSANHFVVFYKFKNGIFHLMNPAFGYVKVNKKEFTANWSMNSLNEPKGIALLLEPNTNFQEKVSPVKNKSSKNLRFFLSHFKTFKNLIFQLIFGLAIGTLLQFLIPFLTQSVVDVGIKNQNLNFVYLVLLAQVFVFFGRTFLEVIRGWILLHLSTRISITLVSDFFIKLMDLPISYFDLKMTGDIMQRIHDQKRLERILTTSTLNTIFSSFGFLVFGMILAYYNLSIFLVFLGGTILYFSWTLYFFRKRKALDYMKFREYGKEQSRVIELINGMQEIKLHNAEKQMRWGWEKIQLNLFNVSAKSLKLEQKQSNGANLINELKNGIITVLCAKLVINGEITLGVMLAVSTIVGQLNAPINQLVFFLRDIQDAKIALERLSEIYTKPNEVEQDKSRKELPGTAGLKFKNIYFKYPGKSNFALSNLNFHISSGKVTAIVGESGSGKSTLLKLILRFYRPQSGKILFGDEDLYGFKLKSWRNYCGTVVQGGYIFNATIAKNIALGTENFNQSEVVKAAQIANIHDFISELPNGYKTLIGNEGVQLSNGQQQRIFIARAVYKNPELLIFDEATSSLDTINEQVVVDRLNELFENKTAIIVAHRLSTVINADKIIVLDKGEVVEQGNHEELLAQNGKYYKLVKNQLGFRPKF